MRKLLTALLFCLSFIPVYCALPTSTVFEVNQAGDNTNGDCFITGASGTNHTYPTPTVTSYTDLVAVTGTTITSAGHPFGATDVGNCLRISSGTGWTVGIYYIVSVAGTTATVDRTIATGGSTGGTGKQGGAGATLAQLNTDMCSGCTAYVKADGTYTITAKVTFNYSNSGVSWVQGYTTTRGDNGKFTLQATSTFGDRMIDTNVGGAFTIYNVKMDVNSEAGVACFRFLAQQNQARNLECLNFNTNTAMFTFNNQRNTCAVCWAHDGTSTGLVFQFTNISNMCWGCVVQKVAGNSTTAFQVLEGYCLYCVVDTLTGTTSDAFQTNDQGPVFIDHAVVYNVSRDAFRITGIGNSLISIQNSVVSTVLNAFDNTTGTTLRPGDIYNDYNFTFDVTGTAYIGLTAGANSVVLSADPFTAASSSNFTLNTAAGGGAAVTNAGTPSSLPGITGTGYPAGGALQPQAGGGSGSGGGSVVFP